MTPAAATTTLLDRIQVAQRLGRSVAWVDKARNATDPSGWPRPMAGWLQTGPPSHPAYRITEAALAEYIEALPKA